MTYTSVEASMNLSPILRRLQALRTFTEGQRQALSTGVALIVLTIISCGDERGASSSNHKPAYIEYKQTDPSPAVVAYLKPSLAPAEAEQGHSKLPTYGLKIGQKELAAMERTAYANETYPATFIANGHVYKDVRVRYRGQWARSWPKKPLKIFFNHDDLFEGQRCLNLNSAWHDPAFIREHLAYQVYAACGVPSPKSRMVRVNFNGQFRGLYVEVEQPEKPLLRRYDLKGASLFKAISGSNQSDERDLGSELSFTRHYEVETKKAEGIHELQLFCHDLAHASNVPEFFDKRVDVEKYINYLAATALVQNWDAFNKNHFLVFDGHGSRKWFVVPWDLDRTFGDHWRGMFNHAQLPALLGTRELPGVTGWNRMADRFLSEPSFRGRFLNRLEQLLQREFTSEKLFPLIDRVESEIASDAALDRQRWPNGAPNLHAAIAQVKSYVTRRRACLLKELETLRAAQ